MMEFKEAVKYLRSELGLTQVELAMGLHMNAITVGRWEKGKTLPTRSITALLLDYARLKGASGKCMDILTSAIHAAARSRLTFPDDRPLAARYETIAELLNNMPGAMAVVEVDPEDIEGTLRTVCYNDLFSSLLGYGREEYGALLKNNALALVFQEDIPTLMNGTRRICSGEPGLSADTPVRCHTKDGGFIRLLLTGRLAERRGNICVLNIVMLDITQRREAATDKCRDFLLHEDIDEREKAEIAARELAESDPLTGIYNREGFLKRAAELVAAKAPGYYVMSCIDVEKFRVINDQYGTQVGDEVLRHIASTVCGFAKSHGGICCRYMADEFAVIYPASLQDTDELAESHRTAAEPDCIPRHVQLRIGRCLINDTTLPISAVFDRAAMAQALVRGRYDTSVIQYDETMRESLLQEQQIVGDMVQALQNGEFEPWFQPQYNHATGALIGAEALVRWNKNGKILLPEDFISTFERNGFIYEVDQSVWRQVCALLRRWLDEGRNPLPVSVNISRHDMFQENFADVLTGLVAAYALPVELLRLEITESAFCVDTEKFKSVVGRLIDAGFTVEIDDFGSGYSSLNALKDVPASTLKLDMRFFETTENSGRGGNIVEAIVRMAKWLGMAVIAEGVEDVKQADYLKSIGCYYIQGYYYSKPVRVEEYEKQMQEGIAERKLSRMEMLETLDGDLFWDPASMETLIFNSYVGGACIFEFCGGKAEMLRYNDQYIRELHGLIPDSAEIQDVTITPFLDESSREKLIAALQEALKSGKEASSEMRLTRGEQTEYVRQTCRVIAKAQERTLYYCVIRNMTEQRTLERERTESAERLSIIMSNVNGGVSAIEINDDGTSRLIFHNDRYYELYGYSQAEGDEQKFDPMRFITPEDFPGVMEKVRRLKADGQPVVVDYGIIRKDGSPAQLRANASLMTMEGYGPIITSVLTDVTEQRTLAEQLRAVVDNINGGVTATYMRDGKLQFVLANEKYYEILGYTQQQYMAEVGSVFDLIHPDDRERVQGLFAEAVQNETPYTMEYRIVRRDGAVIHILCNASVMHMFGVREPVQVAVYSDITDEKEASGQLRFLNELASEILAQPDSGLGLQKTLERTLAYFAGERSYIFELNDSRQTADNTYEVCAEGVQPERERLQGVPYDTQQYWFEAFRKTGFVSISDVAAMPLSEAKMRELLLMQHIRSIIVVPLWRDGRLIGYMGVDNPAAAVEQVSQLAALADYIAVLLTRRDLMQQVEREQQTVQQLVDDTPGGFVRAQVHEDRKLTVVTVNNGLCRMLGMTKAEVMEAYGADAYACLAGEDAAAAPAKLEKAYASGDMYTGSCRLRKKNGELFWVMLFGRFVHTESGQLYLNAYFTDISEQKSLEQLQSELLENLPFGAAMYAYDGKSLTALHINRQYARLVNREGNGMLEEANPILGIHPDDRRRVYDEIRAAIAEGRNGACDIRLLYGADGYRLFHLDATIVKGDDGKYVLYVAYSPITDREQELKITSERLKLLSDSIPGGIATFRCKPGSIEPMYYNDGVCALTGYSRQELDNNRISVLGLIFDEDMPVIREQIELMMSGKTALEYCIRIHTKEGGYRWVECMARVTQQESESVFLISTVLTDVTGQQEERERLRVSEELNRLAIDQSGKIIARYDLATRTLTLPYSLPAIYNVPGVLENMPYEQVRLGRISPETADAYCGVFELIHKGEASGEAVYQQNSTLGWRWLKSQYTTVFASDGRPVSAVITYEDITEQREKEAIYSRWQNAMAERPEDSYTLVRCNLNKDNIMDSWEGKLLRIHFSDPALRFNSRTEVYVHRFVYVEDREDFRAFLNSDTLLAGYHRGLRSDSIDYREHNEDGSIRWLRLSADLVEYPDSPDVEAYLLFEDIDEQKQAELSALRRAETDPLTGLFNRAAFAQRVNRAISRFDPQTQHALIMLDIDGFKQVNDIFGHGAGDQALAEMADTLTHFCRKEDLVCRLGGDEFFTFLADIGSAETAAKKAQQLCDLTCRALSAEVHISVSIGIALYPQDGDSFETLYKAADEALYRTKNAGKNGYCFHSGKPVLGVAARWHSHQAGRQTPARRNCVLLVDDSKTSLNTLEAILREKYYIEKATDGAAALAMLQHYGTAISAVLLNLMMPGMSGFEVLEKMQHDERICTIPVIAVSADEDRQTALRAIRAGASDLIAKPVDADLLRIRVESAISKSENERLRAQNSYLAIRNSEINSYRAALAHTGTPVIMVDLVSNVFSYSPAISEKLAGQYDGRPLWSILLSDGVTDEQTAHKLQQLVQTLAEDAERTEESLMLQLKTNAGDLRLFELRMFKEPDDFSLTSGMIMTLREADREE